MSLPTLRELFTSIANSIRSVKGTSGTINATDFPTQILSMDTSDATATASDIAENKTAYVNGQKITGVLPVRNGNFETTIEGSWQEIKYYITELPDLTISSNTNTVQNLLKDCRRLTKLPMINFENVAYAPSFAYNCPLIETVPLYNTSNLLNSNDMFNGCTNLKNVPVLNTSTVYQMGNMFKNCNLLTDESLDNILQMCINAVVVETTKSLYTLGLDQNLYRTRIVNLPHYQDFLNAGWVIA